MKTMTVTALSPSPHATTQDEPYMAATRNVRGTEHPVVVDQRTDRAEIICETLKSAESLARRLNRDRKLR